jgi:uncharacterized protein
LLPTGAVVLAEVINMKKYLALFLFLISGAAMANPSGNMQVHVLRLTPGQDVRSKLEEFVTEKKMKAALVISAVGSLNTASIRFSNQDKPSVLKGHFEIVSLSGTLSSTGGSHLHISISDEQGKTLGGHLTEGSKIFTTLEVAIGELNDVEFTRVSDKETTYKELKVIPLKK